MIVFNRLTVWFVLLMLTACAGKPDASADTTIKLASFPVAESKVDLPEQPAEKGVLTPFVEPAFSLYLSIADTDFLQLSSTEKDTSYVAFSELETIIERYRLTIPEGQRGRITCDLYLDQALPYLVVDYLKMHLRKQNQLKIRHCVKGGEGILQKMPPLFLEDCYDPPCRKTEVIAEEGRSYLANKGLAANWNAKVYDNPFLQLKPENLFDIQITSTNTFLAREDVVAREDLRLKLIEFIKAAPTRRVIQLKPDPFASYGQYLDCLAAINGAYLLIHNEASLERFQKDYNDLDKSEKRLIRTAYPYVVSSAYVW